MSGVDGHTRLEGSYASLDMVRPAVAPSALLFHESGKTFPSRVVPYLGGARGRASDSNGAPQRAHRKGGIMKIAEEKILRQLQSAGIRVHGKTIVSPFRMIDAPAKDAIINLLIEKAGYTLSDGRGFALPPIVEEAPHA
jgi:hypothetical protein